jgi:hypothetical protein
MPPKQGDLFEDAFDEMIPKRNTNQEQPANNNEISKDEVRTSYLLVNVLLTLLIEKGYIQQQEVDVLLEEMYAEYKRKVG